MKPTKIGKRSNTAVKNSAKKGRKTKGKTIQGIANSGSKNGGNTHRKTSIQHENELETRNMSQTPTKPTATCTKGKKKSIGAESEQFAEETVMQPIYPASLKDYKAECSKDSLRYKQEETSGKMAKLLIAVDIAVVVIAVVIFTIKPACPIGEKTDDTDTLEEYFGNKSSVNIVPSDAPPLNQFESTKQAPASEPNNVDSSNNLPMPSPDSSYGSYSPSSSNNNNNNNNIDSDSDKNENNNNIDSNGDNDSDNNENDINIDSNGDNDSDNNENNINIDSNGDNDNDNKNESDNNSDNGNDSSGSLSGTSSGSNSPSYPNSFGSSSLQESGIQYKPDPISSPATPIYTTRPPKLFLPGQSNSYYATGNEPTESTDTWKLPYDVWKQSEFRCGVSNIKPATRVVGGSVAIKHSWPWTAQIYEKEDGVFMPSCGSTVVSPRHAITANHCFRFVKEAYKLAIGKHDLKDEGRLEDIVRIRRHPFAKNGFVVYYDLALLTLKTELVFGDEVQPACLPPKDKIAPPGEMCYACGWGWTQQTGGKDSLKQVRLEIGSPEECIDEWGYEGKAEYGVCAGKEKRQDTCRGDSGGPLACEEDGKWLVYGATSFGDVLCGSGRLAVYAAISFSLNWLCCFLDSLPECQGVPCDPLDFSHPN